MIKWMRSPTATLEDLGARYGDVFTSRSPVFGTAVNFTHPDAIKEIFTGDPAVFHSGEVNQVLGVYLGAESVLLLDDAAHLHVRRMMLPAFHGERMLAYTATMYEAMRRAVAALTPGQSLSLHGFFQRVTLEVILRAVLGLEDGPEHDEACAQFVRLLDRIQSPAGLVWSMPAFRKDLGALTPWASIKREVEATDRILFAQIAAHREGRGKPDDVLTMLVAAKDEQGKGLSDRALRDQLITLVLAGHETSATALSWAFEEILRLPGEQERLVAEAEGVLGGAPVTAEDLPRMERIDSAIKESLRLHPVIGAVGRRLKKPATIGGHQLPAEILAVGVVHLVHRRPEIYPDPERFVADRFIGKKIDPYTWAPFGGGIRRCLGMAFAMHEMKVLLATLFGTGIRFELERQGLPQATLRSIVYAPKGETRVRVLGKGREMRAAA
jgi:cytochrome P450